MDLTNELKNEIKIMIDQQHFKSKEELFNYLKNFDQNEINIKNELHEILDYYDINNIGNVNMNQIRDYNIDDVNYIEATKSNGEVITFDNNIEDKKYQEIINEKRNELTDLNNNELENMDSIIDAIESEKKEVIFDEPNKVDESEMEYNKLEDLHAIHNTSPLKEHDMAFNSEHNIYKDLETNEVYSVKENANNDKEIINVQTNNTTGYEVNDIKETIVEKDEFNDKIDYSGYTNVDLEMILRQGEATLNEQQKQSIQNEISTRESTNLANEFTNDENIKENNYQKVKRLVFEKQQNGFVSLLILCLITAAGGFGIFFYILFSNNIIG